MFKKPSKEWLIKACELSEQAVVDTFVPDQTPPNDIGIRFAFALKSASRFYDFAFTVSEMPGCCGILVFHNLYAKEKSLLDKALKAMKAIAKYNRVPLIMYNTVDQQKPVIKRLLGDHWVPIQRFTNTKYVDEGNVITVYSKWLEI